MFSPVLASLPRLPHTLGVPVLSRSLGWLQIAWLRGTYSSAGKGPQVSSCWRSSIHAPSHPQPMKG